MWLMLFTHYLFGYVGTALCSIGLVLALCSVYIFTRRQMRSAVATYLVGLSISDSCLLTLGLIIAINSSIPPNQQSELFYSSRLHKYLFPYVYACIIWFQFTSVWVTIGFAVDRWFAIKWPMLHYTYSSKRACYIVLIIYCLGFIYSLPRFFEYKTELQREQLIVIENFTEYVEHLVITNKVLENRLYQYIVHLILYSIFQSVLPLLMLSYFNVELIRSINASSNFLKRFTSLYVQTRRVGREANPSRYREGTITRSVICLIGLFTLCQVPASILHYIYMFYRHHPVLYICYDISNFLILVNSAVNFFIFTYCNRKFRRELARVCFHSTNHRSFMLRTSSHHSFRRTNSYMRTPAQSSHNLQQLDITQTNSWEYQRRSSRSQLQTDTGTSSESINHLRKKYSDVSVQSQYHLHPSYHRSESLINIRTSNIPNNSNQTQRQGRFSVCDFNYQQTNTFPYINDQQNLQITSKQSRGYKQRLLFNRKKHSLTIPTNTFNQHVQPSQCKVNKRGKKKQKSMFTYNPITSSSSTTTTTTTSNLTRSTANTIGSESSIIIDQNKLLKPIANQKERTKRFFQK
ncbi:unnamed protein product [Adineta steineri]|uniref:G-protein coupled receptors family 1 profile domain-containing protein n=1 Tax=Adineta steineri TaxID=433720 RepID=A0A818H8B5_9BILA|nr:unnamed protein product [Adineta steineri]CAF3500803.1 unnamed protein product [Adineta steineri]